MQRSVRTDLGLICISDLLKGVIPEQVGRVAAKTVSVPCAMRLRQCILTHMTISLVWSNWPTPKYARVPTVYLDAQSVWSNWPIVTEATLRACQRSLDAANEDDTCASAA